MATSKKEVQRHQDMFVSFVKFASVCICGIIVGLVVMAFTLV